MFLETSEKRSNVLDIPILTKPYIYKLKKDMIDSNPFLSLLSKFSNSSIITIR